MTAFDKVHAVSVATTPAQAYRFLRLRLPQPWSRLFGGMAYLPRLARGHLDTRLAFAEEALIEEVMTGELPLQDFGVGLSERVVEIPWVVRSLPGNHRARILDVGTAFAPIVFKRLLMRRPEVIEAVDLAPVHVPGIRSHIADVRDLSSVGDAFDVATCISTLEHIGLDNKRYSVDSVDGDDVEALRELGRVARRVLVTVPAGSDEEIDGWLRQYDPLTFRKRAREAQLSVRRLDVFAHNPERGWAITKEDAVSHCRFGQGVYAAAAVICVELERGDP